MSHDFGPAGAALWAAVTARYELDEVELVVLAHACREADIIGQLQHLCESSLMSKGALGQDVVAPHVSEIREHRIVMARLIAHIR